MKWSKEQELAIFSKGTNELLNAGAGSGKTAVLSEHVIYLLENGYNLDELLIVTFTEAAANEMKDRIKKKIEAKPELNAKFGDEIEAAHISTFDAFYLFITKKYHYKFNLENNISILDGNIERIIRQRYINQVLEEYYAHPSDEFKNLIKTYCIKDDKLIVDAIGKVLDQADLKIDKEGFLNQPLDKYFNVDFMNSMIAKRYDYLKQKIKQLRSLVEDFGDERDQHNYLEVIDNLEEAQTYDELSYKLANIVLPSKAKCGKTEQEHINAVKEFFNKNLVPELDTYGDSKSIIETQLQLHSHAEVLFEIARKVDALLFDYKKSLNSFTFHDISHMALRLLNMPDVITEVKSKFRYILIDEYQDTNDMQEEFIKKLENDNLFMVGDVKQSIYRFRNANCMIFQDKYNRYKHEQKGGHVIDMTKNFRSREELVNDFNMYFSSLMSKDTNLIDYKDGHNTLFGLTDYQKSVDEKMHNGILFYKYFKDELKGDPKYSEGEFEARIVAEDIIKKINEGYPVYDGNSQDKKRPATFKDFAIISDKGTRFDEFRRVFGEYNVPLYVYDNINVEQNVIFLVAVNLLKVFKGVKENKFDLAFAHAYASISRSFIFDRDDKDIYDAVKLNHYENDQLIADFKQMVDAHKNEPIKNIFESLLERFDVYGRISTIGDYRYNCAHIQCFTDILENLDNFNFTLDEVIAYFEESIDNKFEITAKPIEESDNSVTILNIHKSKGLEYPIVYYVGLNSTFNTSNLNPDSDYPQTYGPILPASRFIKSQLTRALRKEEERQQSYEEKLRLLYVALTRARESAIIVDICNDKPFYLLDPSYANSFHKMISPLPKRTDRIFDFTRDSLGKNVLNSTMLDNQTSSFELLDLPQFDSHIIEKKRASKEVDSDIDQNALDFGNKMHLYMELLNIETKDLSFIKNNRERDYINKVVNLEIFKGIDNEHIRHEFPFFDDNNKLLGIIDCLLIKDNEIDIIDFKLKHIDDEAYVSQLNAYRNYISKLTDKIVKTYLISIIDGAIKEVKIHE